jgi:mono/diheme cytochrome c family protein
MQQQILRFAVPLVVLAVLLGAGGVVYVVTTGLDAQKEPSAVEARVARSVRRLAVPRAIRERRNPLSPSAEGLAEGIEHFGDHCAGCHAVDGSGNTEMGRGLYPKVPDMRRDATQSMTDGELFYIIEHGVRFTGMPGWSTGTAAGETATWQLVHVIRRLPALTDEDLDRARAHTPRSPADVREEIKEEEFLRGGPAAPAAASPAHAHGGARQ